MKAAGILFDKDGTLLDFEATYAPACARMIGELARDDEALATRMAESVGFDRAANVFLADSIIIAGTAADQATIWAPLLGTTPDAAFAGLLDAMWARYSAASAIAFADAGEILSQLAAHGLKLGIATNDAEANARAHAEVAGIDGLMGFVAGYDSGHGAKPEPGMVEAFARFCGCPPGHVVMVGDSLHDLAAARACGAVAVAVATGPASREDLAPHADIVIDSLAELPALPMIGLAGNAGSDAGTIE